jgi:hypothetical protein
MHSVSFLGKELDNKVVVVVTVAERSKSVQLAVAVSQDLPITPLQPRQAIPHLSPLHPHFHQGYPVYDSNATAMIRWFDTYSTKYSHPLARAHDPIPQVVGLEIDDPPLSDLFKQRHTSQQSSSGSTSNQPLQRNQHQTIQPSMNASVNKSDIAIPEPGAPRIEQGHHVVISPASGPVCKKRDVALVPPESACRFRVHQKCPFVGEAVMSTRAWSRRFRIGLFRVSELCRW